MGMEDIRNRIQALATECDGIAAKAQMDEADFVRIEAITAERQTLERQTAAMGQMNEFKKWAGSSAGMLTLVGAPSGAAGGRFLESGAGLHEHAGVSGKARR